MSSTNIKANELFDITTDSNAILSICFNKDISRQNLSPILILEQFTSQITNLLASSSPVLGIIYRWEASTFTDYYQQLFEAAKNKDFEEKIKSILSQSIKIRNSTLPVVSIIDGSLNSIQLAPLFWSPYIIGTQNTRIHFPDCSYGIFPGLGATVYISRRLSLNDTVALLVKGAPLNAQNALKSGLLDEIATDTSNALIQATEWILKNKTLHKAPQKPLVEPLDYAEQLQALQKKSNALFPGVNPCFELIATNNALGIEKSLAIAARRYQEVLMSKLSTAIMRTMNYGIYLAKKPEAGSAKFTFQKVGIIGAGMMGAGIAFEVARAGMHAVLKDTDMALAQKGKQYTEKSLDKLITLGKVTTDKKSAMLALIQPTENIRDLQASDLIIEAVFEKADLKGAVISEVASYLTSEGFFASNTTSLPISRLAANSPTPENFIGMHFFSPVDRMPLVEIILGKQTSKITVQRARAFALKLQKTPIIVHDSPAFFTSRIFFNYLLEAITMLLEGIPAEEIEREAVNAGFAISPLAVLDEISLPLMVHVYDQLPQLSTSQQRCYHYLKTLIDQQREGRKSGKGFYDYNSKTGKKQLWQDPMIQPADRHPDRTTIQNRLLHVMALDSFRCLDEGVLDQPIDGDIGSIMGVGFAAHTGGAIAHIDEVGLEQFIKDCDNFHSYGEQWQVPASLRKLAIDGFKFYNGFTSNWPHIHSLD